MFRDEFELESGLEFDFDLRGFEIAPKCSWLPVLAPGESALTLVPLRYCPASANGRI